MCDDDAPKLDINSLCAIAALQSGLDFSKESIPTDIILTIINSNTSQAVLLLLNKPLEIVFVINSRKWIPEKIGKLMNEINSINSMIFKCLEER